MEITAYRGTTAEAHAEGPGEFWTESLAAAKAYAADAARYTGGTPVIVTARIAGVAAEIDRSADLLDASYGDRYADAIPGRCSCRCHTAVRASADMIEIVSVEQVGGGSHAEQVRAMIAAGEMDRYDIEDWIEANADEDEHDDLFALIDEAAG